MKLFPHIFIDMIGIYKITNPTNKIYIGKSKDIEYRWKQYSYKKCTQQRKLYNSLQKYGVENHYFEVIEECDENLLNEREIYWIKEYTSVESGLNLSYGGEGGNHSLETINLIKLNKSKQITQYSLEGNFIKEWPSVTTAIAETNILAIPGCLKNKIKQAGGFIWKYKGDINFDFNLSKHASKGTKWKDDRKFRKFKENHGEWNKGRKHPPEEIRKMKIKKPLSGGRKKIIQCDLQGNFIKEWNSTIEAAISLNLKTGSINNNLKNLSKTSGGYIWKYKKNQNNPPSSEY